MNLITYFLVLHWNKMLIEYACLLRKNMCYLRKVRKDKCYSWSKRKKKRKRENREFFFWSDAFNQTLRLHLCIIGEPVDSNHCPGDPPPVRQICEMPCPGDCVLGHWGSWTTCSQSCSSKHQEGKQSRSRLVLALPGKREFSQIKHLECLFTHRANCPWLAEAFYTNSAHHCVIESDKITTETYLRTGSMVWTVKLRSHYKRLTACRQWPFPHLVV